MDGKNINSVNHSNPAWDKFKRGKRMEKTGINVSDTFQKQESTPQPDVLDMKKAAEVMFNREAQTSGEAVWEFRTVKGESFSISGGSDGVMYASGSTGKLYALDEKTGGKIWEFDTKGELNSPPVEGKNGLLYLGGSDNNLHAIDKSTGKMKWAFPAEGQIWGTPAVGPDGTIYFGSSDHKIYAVDGDTGKKKWTFRTTEVVRSTPVIDDKGNIYTAGDDGKVYALDGKTGKKIWSKKVGTLLNTPILGPKNLLFTGSSESKIFAMDRDTGKVKWEHETHIWHAQSPVLTPDGILVATNDTDEMVGLNPETGKELWTTKTPVHEPLTPAVGENGIVYIATAKLFRTNKLYGFDPKDGRIVVERNLAECGSCAPVFTSDGKVVVGVEDGGIQAFNPFETSDERAKRAKEEAAKEFNGQEKEPQENLTITREEKQINIGGVKLPIHKISQ